MIYRSIKPTNKVNKKNKPIIEYEYKYKNGTIVSNKDILNYINKSKSKLPPPSYTNVVINPNKKAKYISTSYDGTKRKQYQYSLYYEELRQKHKICDLLTLGNHLEKIRNDYNNYLKNKNMSKNKIISTILAIIEICNFRIGGTRCLKEFKTYGLTTLIKKHIKIESNNKMVIEFIGKKKQKNRCLIKNTDVINSINSILNNLNNKNNKLFTYFNKNTKKDLTGTDVNNFLKQYHPSITSKEFRTWSANKMFIGELLKFKTIPKNLNDRKKKLKDVDKKCAKKMIHTPAMFRKEYLSPDLRDLYLNKTSLFKKLIINNKNKFFNFDKNESALMNFLSNYFFDKFCKNYLNKNKNNLNKNKNNLNKNNLNKNKK